MAIEHTVLFTVVPRGISLDPAIAPVSVVVSPRLDGADRLGAFPDWVHWTRRLHDDGLELDVRCSAQTRAFPIDRTVLRPDLWAQLFDEDTYVISHATFDDYTDRGFISYSVRETLSALKSLYQQSAVELALPDAPPKTRGDQERRNRDHLGELVDGLQTHWNGQEARRYRAIVRDRYGSVDGLGRPSGPLDSEGLLAGGTTLDLKTLALPFATFHHMPTPEYRDGIDLPDPAKLLDFHGALTSLNAYPALLRALGLVFDLDLPAAFVAATPFDTPGSLSVHAVRPGWEWAIAPRTHPVTTAYTKIGAQPHTVFFATPRPEKSGRPGGVLGLLYLDPAHFGLAQVDVDGAMHKAIMLAETLHPAPDQTRADDVGPQPAAHPEVFDPEATLPSLRSGGFSLFADERARALLAAIRDAKAYNDAVRNESIERVPLYAEDLVRGYRIDVWDSQTDAWHSLHERDGRYVVGDVAFEPVAQREEGYVELAATQPAPGASPGERDIYLHEAIARWAGWSLSVPRPGKHLSRYANAADAVPRDDEAAKFAENEAVTPFRVKADYTLVPGSLPSLRFGRRYRFRARAVDIAGNGLTRDDAVARTLSPVFALPRDPTGFAYLRFEPIPAPLVVIRNEAAVIEPGSAVDRLVIRTFNSGESQDAVAADTSHADRHIVPPRGAIEMGERHGTFDDAAGKLRGDAATWKLIAERDAGELRKRKIALKGRIAPVPDDGSDVYPVEPGDAVDPLPFFPDPLSRGAAFRNLPGTPDGSLASVGPDSIAAAHVAYTVLSDPNPRPGSATLVAFDAGDWQRTHGFRFALAEPGPDAASAAPTWDPVARVLTVYLPKGESAVVPLSSLVHSEDLELMGVWQWLRDYIDKLAVDDPRPRALRDGSDVDRIAHVLQRAVEGGHWMLTPPSLLTLVHAVMQPVGRPEFTAAAVHHETLPYDLSPLQSTPGRGASDPSELAAITAWRLPGATDAYLLGALRVHGASTGRVDLVAEWDDIDDATHPALTVQHRAAHVEELPLPRTVSEYLEAAGSTGTQERKVGFYDRSHDQIVFTRAGDNTTWEDSYFQGAAPRHHFGDTKHRIVRYTAIASSRYREYFDPKRDPKDFTRSSEAVVVDVPASARPLAPSIVYVVPTFGWERQTQTNSQRSVRFGGGLRVYLDRPWFSSGEGELLGVTLWDPSNGTLDQHARDRFKPYFTQWGMDPIWQTANLSGAPGVDAFYGADASDYRVTLEPTGTFATGQTAPTIDVVGFAPQFDETSGLWFADITLAVPRETYMPFVRLALVRYQPRALADAKVSRVVLADFAQLTPDRSALVTTDPYRPDVVRVVVSGVAPRGPVAMASVVPKPALATYPTEIRLRVQRHDDAIGGDLAWTDVAPAVARIVPKTHGPVSTQPDLAMWNGTVEFARARKRDEFRLVIEEHEFVSADYVEYVDGASRQASRLVYAEIFALDGTSADD